MDPPDVFCHRVLHDVWQSQGASFDSDQCNAVLYACLQKLSRFQPSRVHACIDYSCPKCGKPLQADTPGRWVYVEPFFEVDARKNEKFDQVQCYNDEAGRWVVEEVADCSHQIMISSDPDLSSRVFRD